MTVIVALKGDQVCDLVIHKKTVVIQFIKFIYEGIKIYGQILCVLYFPPYISLFESSVFCIIGFSCHKYKYMRHSVEMCAQKECEMCSILTADQYSTSCLLECHFL